jgi:hypothetical protein
LVPSGFAYQFGGGSSSEEEFASRDQFSQDQIVQFFSDNLAWIIIGFLICLMLFLVIWILSAIARGGLIKKLDKMQNIAEEKGNFKEIWRTGKTFFVNVLKVDLWIFVFNFLMALILLPLFYIMFSNLINNKVNAAFTLFVISIALLFFLIIILLSIAKRLAVIFTVNTELKAFNSIKKAIITVLKNKKETLKLLLLLFLINIITGIVLAIASFAVLVAISAPVAIAFKLIGFSNEMVIMGAGISFAVIFVVIILFIKAFTSLWKLDIWIWWSKKICSKRLKKSVKEEEKEEISETLTAKKPGIAAEG